MSGDWTCTPAWLLVGMTGSMPVVLELADATYLHHGRGRTFDTAVAAIEKVVFPWYYFGGGAKFWLGGKAYRVSFVKPNRAEYASARLLAMTGVGLGAGLTTVIEKVVDSRDGVEQGKPGRRLWKGSQENHDKYPEYRLSQQ